MTLTRDQARALQDSLTQTFLRASTPDAREFRRHVTAAAVADGPGNAPLLVIFAKTAAGLPQEQRETIRSHATGIIGRRLHESELAVYSGGKMISLVPQG